MNWNLEKTDDVTIVQSLYYQVLGDELDSSELVNKMSEGRSVHYYLIHQNEGDVVGFGIFLGQGKEVELWSGGVIPSQRRKGAGQALLSQSMRKMAEQNYSLMTVRVFNGWEAILLLLLRHGFRIIETEYSSSYNDVHITLRTEISPKKEIRYALTEKCNFKCVFCHNEGLGHQERASRPTSEILEILSEAVHLGYTDITLTGGEPLFGGKQHKERLYKLLAGLGALQNPPALTMVTNGALLTAEDINNLGKYPGKLKIHVSLHAVDSDSFAKVTLMPAKLFDVVKNNIRQASAAGIKVKVNCVILQGINHNRIEQAIQVARDMGATAIKFVELMVLPDSADDFGLYYDSSAILSEIGKIAKPVSDDNRRRHLFSLNSDAAFKIEVQKCTCAMGCTHCLELRDRTFSSDMMYYPCFVRGNNSFLIEEPSELANVLQQGNRIIDGLAHKFGDSSPTLIKKEQFVAGKREFFYKIDSADRFREYLKQKGFSLVEKQGFHLEYYRPRLRSKEWDNFNKVLKIGWDYHDQGKTRMIYTDHSYRDYQELGLEVTTHYLDSYGPRNFETPESARHLLDRLDFEHYLTVDFNLDICSLGTMELSISRNSDSPTVRICGSDDEVRNVIQAVDEYQGTFEAIRIPLEKYFMGRSAI